MNHKKKIQFTQYSFKAYSKVLVWHEKVKDYLFINIVGEKLYIKYNFVIFT